MVTLPGNKIGTGFALVWRSALRYALLKRWQTILNILGIMSGVMMVVAVDFANNSARQAFDTSLELLNGQITHQIAGGSGGIADDTFTRLKTELGLQRAAPSLSGQVIIGDRELTLVGIDPLSEAAMQRSRPGLPDQAFLVTGNFISALGKADSIIMEEGLAQSLAMMVGDTVVIRSFGSARTATLAAVFKSPNANITGELVLADIAAAQFLLGRSGELDAVDLILDAASISQVQNWLPQNLLLVETQTRNDNLRQMSEAFHINLMAMSLLSLLVAGLLIYNSVTLSVIQRQKIMGIFRAQGVTQKQIFSLVMLENGIVGLLASILGVAAGYLLGRFLVRMVTATVDNLYFDLAVTRFFVDPMVLVKGLFLGVLLSLFSASLPALRAALSRPVTLQHQAAENNEWQSRIYWLALAGILLMGVGWAMLLPEYGSLVSGFIALTFMVFGFCLLVPVCLFAMISLMLLSGRKWLGLSGVMALRNTRSAINRTGLAVAALCVAVSVTVGVGVMVGSFRGTVILWLEQSLPGDMQLTLLTPEAQAGAFSNTMLQDIAAIDAVSAMHYTNQQEIESEFGPVRLGVNSIPAQNRFYIKEATDESFIKFDQGEGVFISEPLAYLQKLNPGDAISLLTESGMVGFPVLGIFYDYTSSSGLVHMHSSLFERYWSPRNLSRLSLELNPAIDEDIVEEEIRAKLSAFVDQYNLVSNRQIRQLTLQIFDRTFAITNVLRMLAILVAFVGVVSTLMALQLEKLREFAILRASGMTPLQITFLVVQQTLVLGICAGLLALPLGLLMSDVLIDVINRRSFGWSMQHFLPESVLIEGFVLALVASFLAGLYPAWRASKIRPALALREE